MSYLKLRYYDQIQPGLDVSSLTTIERNSFLKIVIKEINTQNDVMGKVLKIT